MTDNEARNGGPEVTTPAEPFGKSFALEIEASWPIGGHTNHKFSVNVGLGPDRVTGVASTTFIPVRIHLGQLSRSLSPLSSVVPFPP